VCTALKKAQEAFVAAKYIYFSGPDRAVDPVCICVRAITLERNDRRPTTYILRTMVYLGYS